MPFAQRLTPEQAILAYLWGESTHSYASQPAKAGESVRIVGTDPFIIGSRAVKVNRFYDIIMDLKERFPEKVQFYQYNTGGIGEIIEQYTENGVNKKRMIRKTKRVPIKLMAALQRGDLRGTNRYQHGLFGTEDVVWCEDGDLSSCDPQQLYSQQQIESYLRDIVEGRRQFTEEIASEGLKPEIINIAEQSFQIDKSSEPKKVFVPEKTKTEKVEISVPKTWVSKVRPPRPVGY